MGEVAHTPGARRPPGSLFPTATCLATELSANVPGLLQPQI